MVYGWEMDLEYCMFIERSYLLDLPDVITEFLQANEVVRMGDLLCHTEESLSAIPGFQSEWLPVIVDDLARSGRSLGQITEYSRDPLHDFIQSQNDF